MSSLSNLVTCAWTREARVQCQSNGIRKRLVALVLGRMNMISDHWIIEVHASYSDTCGISCILIFKTKKLSYLSLKTSKLHNFLFRTKKYYFTFQNIIFLIFSILKYENFIFFSKIKNMLHVLLTLSFFLFLVNFRGGNHTSRVCVGFNQIVGLEIIVFDLNSNSSQAQIVSNWKVRLC